MESSKDAATITGYIHEILSESHTEREARHKAIEKIRSEPIIICHRGAAAFAPENTLEACAAALAYGANGCEIDLRYSADRVLICYHDPTIEHLTYGFGLLDWFTYPELLSFGLRSYGAATSKTNVPTFAALVEFARKTNLLLYLDVQVAEEDTISAGKEISEVLDAADAWDHVMAFDGRWPDFRWPSGSLHKHPSYRGLPCLKWLFLEHRADWNPEQIRQSIPPAGSMIMVDDPRLCASLMGRQPQKLVMISDSLYQEWPLALRDDPPTFGTREYAAFLRVSPDSANDLVKLLETDLSNREDIDGDENYQSKRAERILARSWAANRLGQLGRKDPQIVCSLENQVKHRSSHRDRRIHGYDGIAAALALRDLGAIESVPVLIAKFEEIESDRQMLAATPSEESQPKRWKDLRLQFRILYAMAKLPCDATKQFLKAHLKQRNEIIGQCIDYTEDQVSQSLVAQQLSGQEIEDLLAHGSGELCAHLIRECIDHPTPERVAALRAKAPWALELPRAQ